MATTMKSNNAAIAAMQLMLQERCIAEPMFAIKMANPLKSMEGAVNYLCATIQKSGMCCVDESTVMNILVHYFDENEIEDCGKVNCDIVVSKPELSDDDKAELKEQAKEQYREEQLRELRRQSQPKAQSKPTAAPKAGEEINEYRSEHPDGFQESVFKRAVRQYRFHTTVVGHVEHYAADQMYVDFAGDKLEVVDEMTGEVKKAEVFVAILPFSHYTYCEAVWSQRKEDLIKACQNAFEFFGGVTAAIVPDNLKAAVKTIDRNEPVINEEFAAFAEHYGCAVYPARVRHPKDKALVENAVKLLYQSVYLDIEGMVFPSLDELNTAIHISLHDFNERLMAGRNMSRKDMFLQGEKDFLRPLPEKPSVIKERKLMTVGKNCYVSLFKHHYSVPREHVGKRVVILYDADTVEIYCGLTLVATHDRCDIPYTYSWKKEHNLPGHYGPYDKDLEELFRRAAEIDNIVLDYLH